MTHISDPRAKQRRSAPVTTDKYYLEASRILKAELVRRGIGYKELARILGDESYVQLKTKINRGSFSAGFFIKVLRAINAPEIDVSSRQAPEATGIQ